MDASSRSGPGIGSRVSAEASGTFVLVFGVLGTAIFGAGFRGGADNLNDGFLGVALALGLSVFVGASAFGPISGGHFNPAVSIELAAAGRFPWRLVAPYAAAQLAGGLLASSLLAAIAWGGPDGFLATARSGGFASTGWGPLSPGGFPLVSSLLVEVVATGVLVAVVLAVSVRDGGPLGPLAIGLTLTIVALVAIPVSNGSFNPTRSIASAVWGGPVALEQLWLSVVAPVVGAVAVGLLHRAVARVLASGSAGPGARRLSFRAENP